MKGAGRRFVVDADVGQAAAHPDSVERGRPASPEALRITKALNALHRARHSVVFCPSLTAEWKKHAAEPRFGRRWLSRMVEARLVIHIADDPDPARLASAITEHLPVGDHAVARKDLHIVTLAVQHADRRLLSCDGRAREKFKRLCAHVPELQTLHWAAPHQAEVFDWIMNRAPEEPAHALGLP